MLENNLAYAQSQILVQYFIDSATWYYQFLSLR